MPQFNLNTDALEAITTRLTNVANDARTLTNIPHTVTDDRFAQAADTAIESNEQAADTLTDRADALAKAGTTMEDADAEHATTVAGEHTASGDARTHTTAATDTTTAPTTPTPSAPTPTPTDAPTPNSTTTPTPPPTITPQAQQLQQQHAQQQALINAQRQADAQRQQHEQLQRQRANFAQLARQQYQAQQHQQQLTQAQQQAYAQQLQQLQQQDPQHYNTIPTPQEAPTDPTTGQPLYAINENDLRTIIDNATLDSYGGDPTDHTPIEPTALDRNPGDSYAPFYLGDPSSEAVLAPTEVTFEQDPQQATLTDEELDGVMKEAMELNGITDPEAQSKWAGLLAYVAEHESGGGVCNAVNLSDSNAYGPIQSDGNPFNCSRGIWQTIPTTFAANHVPGTSTSIYDPTASCAAAINYIMQRYSCGADGSGLDEFYADRYPTYKGY